MRASCAPVCQCRIWPRSPVSPSPRSLATNADLKPRPSGRAEWGGPEGTGAALPFHSSHVYPEHVEEIAMSDDKEPLPSFGDWLAERLGFHLPTLIPMPQARKNFDKAVGSVWAALGENVAARIKGSTAKTKAKDKIEVEDLFETVEQQRKTENRAKTLGVAADDLNANGPKEDAQAEIEDDWLNLFNRIAEDKSSEELQSVFGRILSGEIRRPGTYSLRTIQFLSTLSKNEANTVSDFMSFAIGRNFVPLPSNGQLGPNFSARTTMQELGIAGPFSGLVHSWNMQAPARQMLVLPGAGFGIVVVNDTDLEIQLTVSCQVLSNLGKELIDISNPKATDTVFLEDIGRSIFGQINGAHADEVSAGKIKVHFARTTAVGGDTYQCIPIRQINN